MSNEIIVSIHHGHFLFQIIDSPLHQQWNVDLYGRILLKILFKMEGELLRLSVNGPKSVSFASFGGTNFKL